MTDCKIAELTDRAVIGLSGDDVVHFLQGLVTNEVEKLEQGAATHAALLTPQGKILFDFFVVRSEDGFLLDCRRDMAAELAKRLTFYRLRAKVEIADRSDEDTVYALWGAEPATDAATFLYADPRLAGLGYRAIVPKGTDMSATGELVSEDAYHAFRIGLGVPEGGLDFSFGDAFPHEAVYDQLGGVDFQKGCYVGQEVVSRMEHRGTARKRLIPVSAAGTLTAGAEIVAGESSIGTLGSVADNTALAMIRLDRAEKAIKGGTTLEAGGVTLELKQPSWAGFDVPGAKGGSA